MGVESGVQRPMSVLPPVVDALQAGAPVTMHTLLGILVLFEHGICARFALVALDRHWSSSNAHETSFFEDDLEMRRDSLHRSLGGPDGYRGLHAIDVSVSAAEGSRRRCRCPLDT